MKAVVSQYFCRAVFAYPFYILQDFSIWLQLRMHYRGLSSSPGAQDETGVVDGMKQRDL